MADPGVMPRTRAARKPFDVRRAEIVRKAASFFAQFGFDATTRDLAEWLGTTQPLMYRYFPSKGALIEEIYQTVFLESWNPEWDSMLTDRSQPLRERLCAFYDSYTDAIMHPEWMRIYLFAGLKGVEITGLYIARVEERIIIPVVREMCAEKGQVPPEPIDPKLLELAWSLQGGIFYYGVRKFVYQTPVHEEKRAMIEAAVDVYIRSWPDISVTPRG
jgi:AcrR family transcriptional regulator